MRALVASLAWQDYRNDAYSSARSVLGVGGGGRTAVGAVRLEIRLVSSLTGALGKRPGHPGSHPLGRRPVQRRVYRTIEPAQRRGFRLAAHPANCRDGDLTVDAAPVTAVEMIPTVANDPLLGSSPVPQGLDQVLLSQTAAEKLGAKAALARWPVSAGRWPVVVRRRTRVQVLHVSPLEAFARDGLFAPLTLLEAAEDYRDGRRASVRLAGRYGRRFGAAGIRRFACMPAASRMSSRCVSTSLRRTCWSRPRLRPSPRCNR